jgi:hypothetical protein
MHKRPFVKSGRGMLLGYARVSKGDEQSNKVQAKALRAAGCRRVFEEAASGGRWDRPELHRMLDQLREGDVVVVWKLDRLSRSLKDVLHIMERIGDASAGFRSITEAIDTTTPAGRMMMQMGWRLRRVRTRHDPGADLRRLGRGARRRPHRWTAQEAGSRQAARNRRERHLWPQEWRRDGATLQHQPADRVTHRRRAPHRPGLAYDFEQIVQ